MIRVLVLIAVTGFLVSLVSLSVAVGIGGPHAIAQAWHSHGHWIFNHDQDDWDIRLGEPTATIPKASRQIAWTGGDSLTVDVPAEITYSQDTGPGGLTVSGPQRALDDLELQDGRLRFKHNRHHWRHRHGDGPLTIVMTALGVRHFILDGSDHLTIAQYRQDSLGLEVSGDADVTVLGETRTLDLQISGSGDTDLSDLKLQDAHVSIAGSGQATLAPTASADVQISGSGDVTLLTRPARLETDISGSGHIHQADRAMPDAPPVKPDPAAKPRPGRT